MDPKLACEIARQTLGTIAAGAKTVVTTTVKGGVAINAVLQKAMPRESDQGALVPADFSGLSLGPTKIIESTTHLLKDDLQKKAQELQEKLQLLEKTALELGDTESKNLVRTITNQLNDGLFHILFVGRFNTGKSSLLNKLLDRPGFLPEDVVPTTKHLTWLCYSAEEKACYQEADPKQACGFVVKYIAPSEISTFRDAPHMLNIFAGVNADILKHGAVLVDTPGLESGNENDDETTYAALDHTDAAILVVDAGIGDVSVADERFIERLKKKGKAEKLFVVINRLDEIPEKQRDGVVQSWVAHLSKLGVRGRIFALSCKDGTLPGFEKFKAELLQFMDTELATERYRSIETHIKTTAEVLSQICAEATKLYGDDQKRDTILKQKQAIFAEEKEIERKIRYQQNEVHKLRSAIVSNWSANLDAIKEAVNAKVQNATEQELLSSHQLVNEVQLAISTFLDGEFQKNFDAVQKQLEKDMNDVSLPVPIQDTMLQVSELRQRGWIRDIPPETATLGLFVYSLFSLGKIGFFSLAGWAPTGFAIWVLSPVFNKILEQLKKVAGSVELAGYKKKIIAEFDSQWKQIDESVCGKIDEYIDSLSEYVGVVGKNTVSCALGEGKRQIEISESTNAQKKTFFAEYQQRLAAIAK
ncbi:hypothetical protein AGMMS49944_16740 [Spirochaetia bacterium]|nr:hypothetical protein AGMMS49944_16740 [Spirochaetia bacterium]